MLKYLNGKIVDETDQIKYLNLNLDQPDEIKRDFSL